MRTKGQEAGAGNVSSCCHPSIPFLYFRTSSSCPSFFLHLATSTRPRPHQPFLLRLMTMMTVHDEVTPLPGPLPLPIHDATNMRAIVLTPSPSFSLSSALTLALACILPHTPDNFTETGTCLARKSRNGQFPIPIGTRASLYQSTSSSSHLLQNVPSPSGTRRRIDDSLSLSNTPKTYAPSHSLPTTGFLPSAEKGNHIIVRERHVTLGYIVSEQLPSSVYMHRTKSLCLSYTLLSANLTSKLSTLYSTCGSAITSKSPLSVLTNQSQNLSNHLLAS